MEEKTPGVLLQAIPYLGQQKILKVFTPEHGLISLMSKSAKNPALTTPFCIAEWVYRKSQKEIHALKEATLLDSLLELRQSYALLTAAGAMVQDLLRSQFPGRSAQSLYDLFCAYLKKLPAFAKPEILAASFRLKLLLHEGLLATEQEPTFTVEEWEQASLLAFSRQFSAIQEAKIIPFDKIRWLFEERIHQ